MRAIFFWAAGLALLLSSCQGGNNNQPPPALDKKLLPGKWKSASLFPFFAGREFAEDGTTKTTIRGAEKPLPGRYAWDGERTLKLEYETPDDARQAYAAALKAYQKEVADRIQSGQLSDRAGPSILGAIPEELPAKETFKVGLSERPRLLILSGESGAEQTYEKAD